MRRRALTEGRLSTVLRAIVLLLLYYLVASIVLDAFLTHWALGDKWRKSRFDIVVSYETERPFVYRVLMPWLVNGFADALPESVAASAVERAQELRARYGLRPGNDVRYVVAYYLVFLIYFATLFAWRTGLRLVSPSIRDDPLYVDLVPPAALLFLPLTFMHGGFLYDPLELLLCSLALNALLARRWIGFYALFCLAILNKESNIVLGLWLLGPFLCPGEAGERTKGWSWLVRHGAAAAVVGGLPFAALYWVFRRWPGDAATYLLDRHLDYLLDWTAWLGVYFEPYAVGIDVPRGLHLFNLLLVGALVWVARERAPRELLVIFAVTVLVLLPLFVLYGWKDELRVFGPAFPALVLLTGAALHGTWRSPSPGETNPAASPRDRLSTGLGARRVSPPGSAR